MSAAAPAVAVSAAADAAGFGHVLAGVALDGPAARLAGLAEAGFLTAAGWDPRLRVLAPPPAHPLLGRPLCRADGCAATAWNGRPGSVCRACWTRLAGLGLSAQEIASAPQLPAVPARAAGCAVTGCGRAPSAPRSLLCVSHRNLYHLMGRPLLEEFLASPRARPLPPRDTCRVLACILRSVCDELRRQQAAAIAECDPGRVRSTHARTLLKAMACHVRRALASPDAEHARDVWDLAVFGHCGGLSFTGISQPWLRQAAKRWARAELPRHRGAGAGNVREAINSLGWLSGSLRARPDHGDAPAALGRADIENDSLAGSFVMQPGDVPAGEEPAEPGRDLPPQVMRVLCENLPALEPPEIQAAVQIAIDTGRRPEDICALPLDCLARDKHNLPVLVYDNAKAGRLGRRLPISESTAQVIAAQQHRTRARFPATPAGELKLLPSPRRNPAGRRPITRQMLDKRHRAWIASLGTLPASGGSQFDTSRIVVYCYRHTYAQRHADAGVAVDVLAELLDHRNLNITRRYYRVEEARRREAVDKVTALSFDRHGNTIWREAAAFLESEHARYAVGEVAVPYGTCTEPSNVAAGGGDCPVRFRCAGCDHFRTNASYLPDLTAYLDDLLRTRERLAAAIDGIDEWARADATPAEEEISRIRRLIGQIKAGIAELPDAERAAIDEAVTIVRRHRSVSLGMPVIRSAAPATAATTEATA